MRKRSESAGHEASVTLNRGLNAVSPPRPRNLLFDRTINTLTTRLDSGQYSLDNIHNEVYNVTGDDKEAGGRAAVEQWQEEVVSVAARGRRGHFEGWFLKATFGSASACVCVRYSVCEFLEAASHQLDNIHNEVYNVTGDDKQQTKKLWQEEVVSVAARGRRGLIEDWILKATFGSASACVCVRSMNKKAQTLGHVQLLRQNTAAIRVYKMCQALPLLPAHMVEAGYDHIVNYAQLAGVLQNLPVFLNYVRRVRITGVGVEFFSVYKQRRRTNNDMESYYKKLRDTTNTTHPNLDNIHNEVYNVTGDDKEAGGRAAVEQWQEEVVSVAARGRRGHIEDWNLKTTFGSASACVCVRLDNIHNEVYNVTGDDKEAGGRAAVEQWQEEVVSVAARGRRGLIEDWILKTTFGSASACVCVRSATLNHSDMTLRVQATQDVTKWNWCLNAVRDTLGLAEVTNKEECFKRICKAGHFFLAVKMITLGEGPICYDGEAFNRPEWKAVNLHRFKRPTQAWFSLSTL
ncbi:hypothetical protein J6590_079991 [Homalodisca vitripennis]|nr:hypothetical protein J6590_079991 [Homalodisca vitripennis]